MECKLNECDGQFINCTFYRPIPYASTCDSRHCCPRSPVEFLRPCLWNSARMNIDHYVCAAQPWSRRPQRQRQSAHSGRPIISDICSSGAATAAPSYFTVIRPEAASTSITAGQLDPRPAGVILKSNWRRYT
ncbi:hypothetical protein J6590_055618 [Homalodisca vitripennis]|nr:hypothetical protein J6590_055618 [Homalodisca vitripennis]